MTELAKEYRKIAELTGGHLTHLDTHFVSFDNMDIADLRTLDGLFQIWDEYCKGWEWFKRPWGLIAEAMDGKSARVDAKDFVGFHADFCRLLVAVLREIKGEKQ